MVKMGPRIEAKWMKMAMTIRMVTDMISMAMVLVKAMATKWIVLLVNGNLGPRALNHVEVVHDLALDLS
jgi:hypothetical protein